MIKYNKRTEGDYLIFTSKFDKDYELYSECAVAYANVDDPRGMPCAHHHNDYELYFLISGSRKYFLSTQIFTVQPNQIMLIKPNVSHQVTINLNIPYERYVLYISPKMMSKLCDEYPSLSRTPNTPFFNLPEDIFADAIELLIKLKQETDIQDTHSNDSIKSTLAELLIMIHRNNDVSSLSTSKIDMRLQNSIDYIIEHYAEQITLEDCAAVACMSHSHFSRVFHKMTALSFKEFLNRIRIDKACELIESTSDSIADISQNVGFSSESYFGYVFRLIKGVSPTTYKKQLENLNLKQ